MTLEVQLSGAGAVLPEDGNAVVRFSCEPQTDGDGRELGDVLVVEGNAEGLRQLARLLVGVAESGVHAHVDDAYAESLRVDGTWGEARIERTEGRSK